MEPIGQYLEVSEYPALFAYMGIAYGGNGNTNFRLPDLRGRTPVAQGIGTGLNPVSMGQYRGLETVTITTENMPPHSHDFYVRTSEGSEQADTDEWLANPVGQAGLSKVSSDAYVPENDTGAVVILNSATVGQTGGGQAMINYPPQIGVRYCLATQGLFPPRP